MTIEDSIQLLKVKQLENFNQYIEKDKEYENTIKWLEEYLLSLNNKYLPSRGGYWQERRDKDYYEYLKCSCCGFETGRLDYFNYCPHCGAYMKGEK